MKMDGVFLIMIVALLVANAVGEWADLKPSAKTRVVDGHSTFYKVRIAVGSEAINNGTLTVRTPNVTRLYTRPRSS